MSETQSLHQFLADAPNADHTAKRWAEGPRISADDLASGSRAIERVTSRVWWDSAKSAGQPAAQQSVQPQRPTGNPNVIRFGKYRGRPMAVVQDEDPGYFAWCCRDVSGFADKARKAGLLDGEDEDS